MFKPMYITNLRFYKDFCQNQKKVLFAITTKINN